MSLTNYTTYTIENLLYFLISLESNAWIRKMRIYFRGMDVDNEGIIAQSDMRGMADKLIGTKERDSGEVGVLI